MKRVVLLLAIAFIVIGLTIPSVSFAGDGDLSGAGIEKAPTEEQECATSHTSLLSTLIRSVAESVSSIFTDDIVTDGLDDPTAEPDEPLLDPFPDPPPPLVSDRPDLDEDPWEELK
jgi:hypothetical protein